MPLLRKLQPVTHIGFVLLLITLSHVHQQACAAGKIESAGDIIRLGIPVLAWETTFFHEDSTGRKQLYKGFITNVAVTYALKFLVHKKRPMVRIIHSHQGTHPLLSRGHLFFISDMDGNTRSRYMRERCSWLTAESKPDSIIRWTSSRER